MTDRGLTPPARQEDINRTQAGRVSRPRRASRRGTRALRAIARDRADVDLSNHERVDRAVIDVRPELVEGL